MARLSLFGFFALAFVAKEASAFADGADAPFDAVAWIQIKSQNADGPDMEDLDELKGSNPEAYALVKALLVKNSLGLIRRKETPPSDADNLVSEDSAVAAPPTAHKSFFNWKPTDDSETAQSVLGQVPTGSNMAGIAKSAALNLDAPPPSPPVEVPLPPQKDVEQQPTQPTSVAPDATEDDLFSKGASQVTGGAAKPAGGDAGGKEGAFWSGLFKSKPKKHRQQQQQQVAVSEEKKEAKKETALPATNSYLNGFDWNSDDGGDKTESSSSSSDSSTPQNNYMKFLS